MEDNGVLSGPGAITSELPNIRELASLIATSAFVGTNSHNLFERRRDSAA